MIIAEIGLSHEGSLGTAHSYIDALAKTEVDTIKFQTHVAEAESSENENFRVAFSKQDQSRMDYWERTSFKQDDWFGLVDHCNDVNIEFLSTAFDLDSLDLINKMNLKRLKIPSGQIPY